MKFPQHSAWFLSSSTDTLTALQSDVPKRLIVATSSIITVGATSDESIWCIQLSQTGCHEPIIKMKVTTCRGVIFKWSVNSLRTKYQQLAQIGMTEFYLLVDGMLQPDSKEKHSWARNYSKSWFKFRHAMPCPSWNVLQIKRKFFFKFPLFHSSSLCCFTGSVSRDSIRHRTPPKTLHWHFTTFCTMSENWSRCKNTVSWFFVLQKTIKTCRENMCSQILWQCSKPWRPIHWKKSVWNSLSQMYCIFHRQKMAWKDPPNKVTKKTHLKTSLGRSSCPWIRKNNFRNEFPRDSIAMLSFQRWSQFQLAQNSQKTLIDP